MLPAWVPPRLAETLGAVAGIKGALCSLRSQLPAPSSPHAERALCERDGNNTTALCGEQGCPERGGRLGDGARRCVHGQEVGKEPAPGSLWSCQLGRLSTGQEEEAGPAPAPSPAPSHPIPSSAPGPPAPPRGRCLSSAGLSGARGQEPALSSELVALMALGRSLQALDAASPNPVTPPRLAPSATSSPWLFLSCVLKQQRLSDTPAYI